AGRRAERVAHVPRAALAAVRQGLHRARRAPRRYVDWLGRFVRGDLGVSAAREAQGNLGSAAKVSTLVADRFANSAILAGATILLLVPLGILLGVIVATRAGRPVDHAVSLGSV